jgi:hypothetical protein
MARLGGAVGEFCNVMIYRAPGETGLRFIGLPGDVQFATWLLNSLADFVFEELVAHLIGCLAPKSERRIIIRSFTEACCDRIAGRLCELVERSKAARTSNGRELVVVQDAAIKAFMKDHNIHLRKGRVGGSANVNEAALASGRAAGDSRFVRPSG